MSDHPEPTLPLDDPGRVRRIRDALDRAGYGEAGLQQLLPVPVKDLTLFGSASAGLAAALGRPPGPTPLASLARLFLLGVPVELAEAARALDPSPLEEWVGAGLLAVRGDSVRATVKLFPAEGLLLAGTAARPEGGWSADLVMPISGSLRVLAQVTVRRQAGQALDLGTGSGVQALLAARPSAAGRCKPPG